jgi:hypothetical protein
MLVGVVVSGPRLGVLPRRPLGAPPGERDGDRDELETALGELDLDPGRGLPVALPGDHPEGAHPLELTVEDSGADLREELPEGVQAQGSPGEGEDDGEGPVIPGGPERGPQGGELATSARLGLTAVPHWHVSSLHEPF